MKYLETIEEIHEEYPGAKFTLSDYIISLTMEDCGGSTIIFLDKFGNLRVLCNNYGKDVDKFKLYNFMEKWSIKLKKLEKELVRK